jgi:hypothetical protein
MLHVSVICIIICIDRQRQQFIVLNIAQQCCMFCILYNYCVDRQRQQFIVLNNAQQSIGICNHLLAKIYVI